MEVDHKDIIDKNYMLFIELLRLKSVPLIKYLFDEEVLTEKEATKTLRLAAHTLRAMSLLDNMLKLEPQFFDILYAAILFTKLWTPADILEPKNRPHKNIYEAPQIPLPDVWPDENYFKELENKELEIKPVDPEDARMQEWYEQSKKYNVYDMTAEIKGRVLIINNSNFDSDSLEPRPGSKEDVEGLEKIFKRLGFKTETHPDLNHIAMKTLLDQECRKDHSEYKCFFLIIMSHGNKGVVYGTNGYRQGKDFINSLKIEDIKDQFCKVKSLERKPKVFIIQACQGRGENVGVSEQNTNIGDSEEEFEDESTDPTPLHDGDDVTDDGDKVVDDRSQAMSDGNEAFNDGNQTVAVGDNEDDNDIAEDDTSDDEADDEDGKDRKSDRNDDEDNRLTGKEALHVFIAMSTTEGYLSHRDPTYGTWFIQAIIFVIANYAWKEDLRTLMLKVNDLVRKAKTKREKRKPTPFLQVPETKESLMKRFYFFPGMPLETKQKPKSKPVYAMPL